MKKLLHLLIVPAEVFAYAALGSLAVAAAAHHHPDLATLGAAAMAGVKAVARWAHPKLHPELHPAVPGVQTPASSGAAS